MYGIANNEWFWNRKSVYEELNPHIVELPTGSIGFAAHQAHLAQKTQPLGWHIFTVLGFADLRSHLYTRSRTIRLEPPTRRENKGAA
jgi:hypothetical protein